ncbi:MAG: nickel pincer cofactor biosynthesis protein LarB [Canidatus Methanoxibalbensis ujae]|nr:nickel pincer cofactor biosynthesis protein LarB [Candidatus Methanoxibalbensis ujae]MCW7077938.1 nickel pincer cofactor biosynthesis protein LarB [Candidatus Methanoxibalbensis ujae]
MRGETAENENEILRTLKCLASGDMSVEEAYERICKRQCVRILRDFARIDTDRMQRTGIPEIIFAEGKSSEQVAEIAIALASSQGFALVSRASEDDVSAIKSAIDSHAENFEIEHNKIARTVLVKSPSYSSEKIGKISIIAAGTADMRVAEEARVVAEVCGCDVITAYDVGIAGLHRLSAPLERMLDEDVSAIIVVAGMEGALPSVVTSLVDVPVIGVPSSIGYGIGGRGVAALLSMLQSCTPGLAVVNIDNGVAAGALAARIVRACSRSKNKKRKKDAPS